MIILKCIKERNKLRIKFYKYIDVDGVEHYNVYDNSYNCQFPRNIRLEGQYYKIPDYA